MGESVLKGLTAFIVFDTAAPEPTDFTRPKWAGYAVATGALSGLVWMTKKGEDEEALSEDGQIKPMVGNYLNHLPNQGVCRKTKEIHSGFLLHQHERKNALNKTANAQMAVVLKLMLQILQVTILRDTRMVDKQCQRTMPKCVWIAIKNFILRINNMSEILVEKDEENQTLVPSIWRETLVSIVEAIKADTFEQLSGVKGVKPISESDADIIRTNIASYGCRLSSLLDKTWQSSACQWMREYWDVLIDLCTEEGISDLVLSVRIYESEDGFNFEVQSVYVP
ncbi:DUF7668 domain-containing protein [Gynuella sp.]|uniref:DUF7668 domain-containing protein n=1 Tax=Gynuella sp. TaxID=2969146 RepID=UPI003D14040C